MMLVEAPSARFVGQMQNRAAFRSGEPERRSAGRTRKQAPLSAIETTISSSGAGEFLDVPKAPLVAPSAATVRRIHRPTEIRDQAASAPSDATLIDGPDPAFRDGLLKRFTPTSPPHRAKQGLTDADDVAVPEP
jgi:hypothetical protein